VSFSLLEHIFACFIALVLIVCIQIQDVDLSFAFNNINEKWFESYTPHFSGLYNLFEHEIFSPEYQNTKKIVLLGASAVDSYGCDSTWHKPDETRNPSHNVSHYCTITNHLNNILNVKGYKNYHVFNLGVNGGKLSASIYVYARILDLKPDLVIFADTNGYYALDRSGGLDLSNEQYTFIDKKLRNEPLVYKIWKNYFNHLKSKGVDRRINTNNEPIEYPQENQTAKVTLNNLIEWVLEKIKNITVYHGGPPLPPKYIPFIPNGSKSAAVLLQNDSDYGFLQGIEIIPKLQQKNAGKFLFMFMPLFRNDDDPQFIENFNKYFGEYIINHGALFSSDLLKVKLTPVTETYDGTHQTYFGNKKIAFELFEILKKMNLISKE